MLRMGIALVLLASVTFSSLAADQRDNSRLVEMYKADQDARNTMSSDWSSISRMDKAHREEALALLRSGEVRTARDFYHVAMIMRHGNTTEDYQLAFALSRLSTAIDPSNKGARWLSAAAWDRILMSKDVPQWYGTQYRKPGQDAPLELYPVDESVVSDEERAALNVPSLQESKDRVLEMNK